MNLLDLMRRRRSIRKFKPDPVARESLEQLVEAAIAAPSGSNRQPWRFVIVQERAVIANAKDAVAAAAGRLCSHMTEVFREDMEAYAAHFCAFAGAPAVIAVLRRCVTVMDETLADDAPASEREMLHRLEDEASLVSVSLATQNLLLMAEEVGLGACCMTGPLIAADELNTLLNVPEGWAITCLVAVGRPDETPESPGRRPAKKVTRWIGEV